MTLGDWGFGVAENLHALSGFCSFAVLQMSGLQHLRTVVLQSRQNLQHCHLQIKQNQQNQQNLDAGPDTELEVT